MPKKSMSESNGIVGSKKGSFLTAFVSPVFRLLKSESVGILCSKRMIFDQFQFPANFYSNRLTGWPISVCGVIACRSDPRFLPPPLPSATLATKSIDYSGILGVILPPQNSIFPEFLSILKDRSYKKRKNTIRICTLNGLAIFSRWAWSLLRTHLLKVY